MTAIQRDKIAQLIPHGETMCLLDQITEWDEHQIYATTSSHRQQDNPMIENGRMDTIILVEYGAQAAAVHAALQQSGLGAARPAYLGAIKKLRLFTEVVDASVVELQIQAECIFSDSGGAIYDISAKTPKINLMAGRIVLVQP
ncbi:MAG: phosphotransferase [Thiohalomonadales bacterium]